ncbi:hypothetical protein HMPREF0373_01172 [Eubacterium ramulus ATCC 29099]|uniref:Uncharacterized protein n=1 Tax=Eubacterium ramulus ATCC 29099 TaxID=1256908 RepID=U2R786_EUBRA|nr:hypothetical protein HMPREF0373_01172 [Eubacterium ramulus ATCC 29099]
MPRFSFSSITYDQWYILLDYFQKYSLTFYTYFVIIIKSFETTT